MLFYLNINKFDDDIQLSFRECLFWIETHSSTSPCPHRKILGKNTIPYV